MEISISSLSGLVLFSWDCWIVVLSACSEDRDANDMGARSDTRYADPSSHNCSSGPFRVQQHAMLHTVAKERGWIRVVCLVPCDFWKVGIELHEWRKMNLSIWSGILYLDTDHMRYVNFWRFQKNRMPWFHHHHITIRDALCRLSGFLHWDYLKSRQASLPWFIVRILSVVAVNGHQASDLTTCCLKKSCWIKLNSGAILCCSAAGATMKRRNICEVYNYCVANETRDKSWTTCLR